MTIDGTLFRRLRAHFNQEHRYRHVVGVARCADLLAQRHGLDPRRARTAGLLHDLARLWPAEALLAQAQRRGLPIDAFARANPIVLHAPLGAALAREQFGITDDGILRAIAAHTLAAPNMSPLDQVVYLADALEPGRTFAERADFLRIAYEDLRGAMRAVLHSTVVYLKARGLAIAPQTLAALAEYEPAHA